MQNKPTITPQRKKQAAFLACKKSCPACSCRNKQYWALKKALPHFRPITLVPNKIAELATRVGVEPEKLQGIVDGINKV
jgi:hypothetical protein